MSSYFYTDQLTVDTTNVEAIKNAYANGFVFTRLGKGIMQQTRSLRIDLTKWKLNSENRRVLRKTEKLHCEFKKLPLKNYSWEIHKMGKEFYQKLIDRYSDVSNVYQNPMSAAKIKEMFNDMDKSNMNGAYVYTLETIQSKSSEHNKACGYTLCYEDDEILHYAYPFYKFDSNDKPVIKNLGMGMMIRGIQWAYSQNKRYVYLGSVVEKKAKYKLQFEGLEWFDTENKEWSSNVNKLKALLQN